MIAPPASRRSRSAIPTRPPAVATTVSVAAALVAGALISAALCAVTTPAAALAATSGAGRLDVSPSRPDSLDVSATLARLDSLGRAGRPAELDAALDSLLAAARSSRLDPASAPLPADRLLAELKVRRGARRAGTGEARLAEPLLREGLALATALGDTALQCAAVRWLSVAVGMQGRRDEAHDLYLRLGELARASGDDAHLGWSLVGLAWEATEAGHGAEAADLYRQAGESFAAGGAVDGEIWALNGRGLALSRLGDRRGAVACYRQVAERAREAGYTVAEALALNNIGHHEYLVGDPGQALRRFERALRLQQAIGNRREAVTPAVNLALARTALGDHDRAEALLDSVLAACREQGYGDLEGMVLNELARVSLARERPGEAAGRWREALALGPALTAELRARCLVGLAGAVATGGADRSGRSDPAARPSAAAEEALRILEAGAAELAGLDLGAYAGVLDLELGRRRLQAGRPAAALPRLSSAMERARRQGRASLEVEALGLAARCEAALARPDSALARLRRAAVVWERDRSLPLDPEWREQRGTAGRAVFTDLAAGLLAAGDVGGAFAAVQPYKARVLRERMSGPATAADTTGAPPAAEPAAPDLAHLQAAVLRPDELLLDAYLGPRTSLLFAVDRDTCLAIRWPAAGELEPRLRRYHELLAAAARQAPEAGSDPGAWLPTARALAELLLGGVAGPLAGARRVLVCPDGALALVPLGELPLPGAGPQEWVRVPSVAILADLRRRADREAAAGTAAGAAPQTTPRRAPEPESASASRPDPERARVLAASGGEGTFPLPGARREVRRLAARYLGVSTWPRDPADRPPDLAAYDLIHLAAHARGDDQRPWRSEIELLPAGDPTNYTAASVAALRLDARLVVLASCSSAGSRVLDGEGLLGLGSAFLAAGVPAVVATLWPVEDETAERFTGRLYEELADGRTVAAAVRRAQAALRDEAGAAHPARAAGFVVIGDGDVTVPLRRRPPLGWALGAAVAISIVVGWLLQRRRRA